MTGALLMLLWAFLATLGAAGLGVVGPWLLLPAAAGGWIGYRLAARRLARLAERRARGKTNCPFLASTWWP